MMRALLIGSFGSSAGAFAIRPKFNRNFVLNKSGFVSWRVTTTKDKYGPLVSISNRLATRPSGFLKMVRYAVPQIYTHRLENRWVDIKNR